MLLNEEFAFLGYDRERYLPYGRRAERAMRVAILNRENRAATFLLLSGGTAEVSTLDLMPLYYNLTPPHAEAWKAIPPAMIASMTSQDGTALHGVLADDCLDSEWSFIGSPKGKSPYVEIQLAEPIRIAAIRLVNSNLPGTHYPRSIAIASRSGNDEPWPAPGAFRDVTGFFWSGPRPYFRGAFYRLDVSFPATEAVSQVRLYVGADPKRWKRCISEIQVFTLDSSTRDVAREASLPALRHLLEVAGIRRLYCDRWEANRLCDQLLTSQDMAPGIEPGEMLPFVMEIDRSTGMLVHISNAALAARALEAAGILMAAQDVGPWVLFIPRHVSDGGMIVPTGRPALNWCGFGPLLTRCRSGGKDANL